MSSPSGHSRSARAVCEDLKAEIVSGRIAPGSVLPSTRALAIEWGVSRTTVTVAYEQLIAEGYIETRQGRRARVRQGANAVAGSLGAGTAKGPERLSEYGRRVAGFDLPAGAPDKPLIADFRYGDLAGDDFPTLALRRAVNAVLLRRERLRYADPCGLLELRVALQGYLWRARGLRCAAEQIVIVNGSQQGLDLCARLLVGARDAVLIEEPGYYLARQAFEAVGADLVPVSVDQDGMRTDRLPIGRLAYTTPSHQFPLGGVMSVGRRWELLVWAQQCDAYVIEDDYDSEYRYDIAPIPPLQSLDDEGRVIYLGTFSKTLSPTLRLGYLVLPRPLAHVFAKAKRIADRHSSTLEQEALAHLIDSGGYERHVRRIRRRNGERRGLLLAAIGEVFGTRARVVGDNAGLHVVVWFDAADAQEDVLISRALAAGVGVHPVTPQFLDPSVLPPGVGLVMGYAALSAREIKMGIEALGTVL